MSNVNRCAICGVYITEDDKDAGFSCPGCGHAACVGCAGEYCLGCDDLPVENCDTVAPAPPADAYAVLYSRLFGSELSLPLFGLATARY